MKELQRKTMSLSGKILGIGAITRVGVPVGTGGGICLNTDAVATRRLFY